jgi:prepilin-type N-terminal cleavage/methylation domain-containing protein
MSRARSTAGLTLIEVAISLAILSLGLAGLFSCVVTSQHATTIAKEQQAASEEALRQLDLLMSNPDFNAVLANPDQGFHVAVDTGSGEVNLKPASAAFFDPVTDDPSMAGHVRLVQNPDGVVPASDDLLTATAAWTSSVGG